MTTISIRIDDNDKETLQNYANENDLSVSQIIRKAIREFLNKEKEEKN